MLLINLKMPFQKTQEETFNNFNAVCLFFLSFTELILASKSTHIFGFYFLQGSGMAFFEYLHIVIYGSLDRINCAFKFSFLELQSPNHNRAPSITLLLEGHSVPLSFIHLITTSFQYLLIACLFLSTQRQSPYTFKVVEMNKFPKLFPF